MRHEIPNPGANAPYSVLIRNERTEVGADFSNRPAAEALYEQHRILSDVQFVRLFERTQLIAWDVTLPAATWERIVQDARVASQIADALGLPTAQRTEFLDRTTRMRRYAALQGRLPN